MVRRLARLFGFRGGFSRAYRASSVVLSFSHDGLAIARAKKTRRWLPIWHVIFFVYMAMLIRLVIMADMGPGGYASRMAELENGTALERLAARVMAMDPVSQEIAKRLRSSLISINDNILERDVWSG